MPAVVMGWGGWEDWPTFRDHYLGESSPEAADRERSKVAWMDGDRAGEGDQESLPFTLRDRMSNPVWRTSRPPPTLSLAHYE